MAARSASGSWLPAFNYDPLLRLTGSGFESIPLPLPPILFFNDFKVIFNVLPYGRLTALCDTNPRVINGNIIYNKSGAGKRRNGTWNYE